ncbi:hemolysin XhlA family protein [Planococcus plakortidis]
MTVQKSLTEHRLGQVEQNYKELEERVDELEDFKTATIEKLKTLFEKIKDLNDSNQWLKRTLFTMIGGGVVTIITTILLKLIQS